MATKLGDIVGGIADDMAKEQPKRPAPNREKLEAALEHHGFCRAIAGDADFEKALNAITLARVNGRGLLISGPNGVGKTRLMKAYWDTYHLRVVEHPAEKRGGYHYPAQPTERYHVGSEWIDCNEPDHLQWLTQDYLLERSIFLDDYGAERMLYGDVDAVGAFICRWHARHKDGTTFNMTTNLDSEQLNNRSGGRVLDRLCEDCVLVKLEGDSKRKVIKVV